MSGNFVKKGSSVFVTFLIGIIVVSFMFTGYETMKGTPDTVAQVAGKNIKAAEYQQEYQRQLSFFKQFMGGQDLTTQQIESFGIRQNTLRNLIQRKLMLKFADEIGISPAAEAIKEEIKKLPYFLTNERFDLDRYKGLLAANGYTPTQFEADISDQMKGQLAQQLTSTLPLSDKYLDDVARFKSQKLTASLVQFGKEALRRHLVVKPTEIAAYLAIEENSNRVQSLFNDRKAALDQPEEVKARHILIKEDPANPNKAKEAIEALAKKVTPANFAKMAESNTEDPSGKGTGGDLGSFGRGRMVPAFEAVAFAQKVGTVSAPVKTEFGWHIIYVEGHQVAKPAVFTDHRETLTTELIRKTKDQELATFVDDLSNQIQAALNSGNTKEIDALTKKYNLSSEKNINLNRYDGPTGQILLQTSELKDIFSKGIPQSETYFFDQGTTVTVVKTLPGKEAAPKPEDLTKDRQGLQAALSRKLSQNVLKHLEANYPAKVYNDLLPQ
jgi:peptidyl-prolyl cis-trans isomerase D